MYRREYFYFLSERGRLYHLIDPAPFMKHGAVPSGPAYLTNEKFLKFFWRHLRRTPRGVPVSKQFPFVSFCASEANFLACEDAPVVFTDLNLRADGLRELSSGQQQGSLTFDGAKEPQAFSASRLRTANGRLYHPVDAAVLPKLTATAPLPDKLRSDERGAHAEPPIAVVFAEDSYECLELHYPRLRLSEAGYDVRVVGPASGQTYKSKEGYAAESTHTVADIDPRKVQVVVVPGGYCPDRLRRDSQICEWLAAAHKHRAVIGFICHGAWLPISAKIIKGHRVTCFSAIKDDVINAGANYVADERVVVDRNMVTAQTPDDLPGFMAAILELAQSKDSSSSDHDSPSKLSLPHPSPFITLGEHSSSSREVAAPPCGYGLLESHVAMALGFAHIEDVEEEVFQITIGDDSHVIPPLPVSGASDD